MFQQTLGYQKRGVIANITLYGDDLSLTMHYDLIAVCEEMVHDDGVWIVTICGEAGRFPVAAPDATESAGIAAVANIDRPVIVGLTGDVSGAALELALAGDIRVAADGIRLALPQVAAGDLPLAGGGQRLARLVGKPNALEMLLLAKEIDAAEAYRIGLVNRVVPTDQVVAEVDRIADVLATRAPIALRYAKEAIHKGLDMTLQQGLRLEMDLYLMTQTTDDRAEGIAAFLERRTPRFLGK